MASWWTKDNLWLMKSPLLGRQEGFQLLRTRRQWITPSSLGPYKLIRLAIGIRLLSMTVETVANERGLIPKMNSSLSTIIIEYIDQVNESDMSLMTRLSK